jgi:hypothetical protein
MPAVARILDGEKEAKLIALACSKPPKGRARWTLRLLENKVVELGIVDRASDSTIGRALKKILFSPIAPVLGHPAEGQQRVRSRHGRRAGRLHTATQQRLSAGLPRRDLEATRCRDARADAGHVKVTDRHTAVGYAHVLKDLADIHFAHAKTIVLVQDNLSIHSEASLYEAFSAVEARRLVERF